MSWRSALLAGSRLVGRRGVSAGQLRGAVGAGGTAASGMGNSTSSLGESANTPVKEIQIFHDMNVNYKVVELDMLEYGSQFQDALYKMTGERTVPRIFVNGIFIGGAIDTYKLHEEGKLLPLVRQCYLKKSKRKEFQ
ncbi:glutaredoxin 2 isoform X3 [Cavia porcellus]|uniref:glutaredoxin 2 isoform X3 n=1 Tax=Cavia porcellus TaxID=10141 RepID=UPI000350B239|nr:glutaredoxin 2 isoform X3 [Cavia porcellus]